MTNTPPSKTNPTPAFQALLGVLPFLIYGLICIWMHFGISPPGQSIWLHPYMVFDALVLVGFGAGLLAGCPCWAYSYLWWVLLFTWWMYAVGMNGLYKLDPSMWLLLLGGLPVVVLVLALLVRRSIAPLRLLLAGLWNDWTLLSLGFFTFYAWISIMFDENHNPHLLVLIIVSTLAVCTGTWFYFQPGRPIRRVLGLIAGMVALMGIGAIDNATWDWRAYYHLPKTNTFSPLGAVLITVILALMYLTGYLSQKRLNSRNKP